MSEETIWIQQLRAGDSAAAEKLWQSYFQKMVELARKKLEGAKKAASDEEDVALSAFKSFCMAAQDGRFPQLVDRSNLWPLLVSITANKSVDAIRRENRKKRGGTGQASGDSLSTPARRSDAASLSQVIGEEPSPDFAAQVADEFQALLMRLDLSGDPDLKTLTLMKLEGHSTTEIAEHIGCAKRTVERKLQVVERLLSREADSE